MKLGPNDLHFVFDADEGHSLKCYRPDGQLAWKVAARGDGVHGPGWKVQGGDTPPGRYEVVEVIETQPDEPPGIWASYGRYFLRLADLEPRPRGGATGVGVHGGRDRSPGRPPASWRDLAITEGCVRVDDDDLERHVVPSVRWVFKNGGRVFLTAVRK